MEPSYTGLGATHGTPTFRAARFHSRGVACTFNDTHVCFGPRGLAATYWPVCMLHHLSWGRHCRSLDKEGRCCSTGAVDVCGVCGGTAVAIDSLGTCCSLPLPPSGICCAIGTLDSCGVCGGENTCRCALYCCGCECGCGCMPSCFICVMLCARLLPVGSSNAFCRVNRACRSPLSVTATTVRWCRVWSHRHGSSMVVTSR